MPCQIKGCSLFLGQLYLSREDMFVSNEYTLYKLKIVMFFFITNYAL